MFRCMREGNITFAPTYKFDKVPAACHAVLLVASPLTLPAG